jgi:hypothetical protein
VRTWRSAAARRRRKKQPCCTTCGQRISRSEPDVTLEHARAPGKLAFHERCALDAYKAVVGGEPSAWLLTHRHIDERIN